MVQDQLIYKLTGQIYKLTGKVYRSRANGLVLWVFQALNSGYKTKTLFRTRT